ncbi:hypothetical protein HN51_058512 [Arachis hypogaea]|uniref:uncharacterized protein LOC107624427 n=1 Tax=Arachis ipaensis TaxID=130454 RepID=UPI0007AF77CB|nr:uncharacterized protein LOC107624427 [Arachis ipaensis]XP_025683783.1 uncharacterized protein LOC112784701 [Arachis hypogaea]XP_029152377.1 uncharacterized protein LOC112784701 [Arachis hypogaea]QHN81811.1 uncharacterized protein DS421_20g690200 [Arachis hypogaea]
MKPESKRKSDKAHTYSHEKPSCFDSFAEMSNALLNFDITIRNQSSPNIIGSATNQDPNSIQSLSKDCFDFNNLWKTLNYIEKKNAKRIIVVKRVDKKKEKKMKRKKEKEEFQIIKFLTMNPKKPFESIVRVKGGNRKEQNSEKNSDNQFGLEEFIDAVNHGGFHLRTRIHLKNKNTQ